MLKTFITILLLSAAMYAQLVFDGSKAQHVSHGTFYPTYSPNQKPMIANAFTLDVWAKVSSVAQLGYLVSSGYGGSHAVLFGVSSDGQKFGLTGNIRSLLPDNTQTTYSFSSPITLSVNTWYLLTVELNNNVITTYANGVPQSQSPFSGQRIASNTSDDPLGGELFVGGSDHLNFTGSIGQLRLIEGHGVYQGQGFIPEFSLGRARNIAGTATSVQANLLADYARCGSTVTDDGIGYLGKTHPGSLYSALTGLGGWRYPSLPLPTCVKDSTYPIYANVWIPPTPDAPNPPANAVVFDSFSRADVGAINYPYNFGVTEVGNKTWNAGLFGIQSNHATYASVYYYQSALVNAVANGTVSVSRVGNADTGIRFRSVDDNNGWAACTASGNLYLVKIVNGGWQTTWNQQMGTWSGVIVTMQGNQITATAGNAVITITDGTYQTATKAGLYAFSPTQVNKYDNFLVTQ